MRYSIFLFVLICTQLQANSVHKWVDGNGNIYYGDQPPAQFNTESVAIPKTPRNASNSAKSANSEQNKTDSAQVPADQAAIACQNAMKDLNVIESSSRIQTKDPEGNLRYLSTEEIEDRQQKTEAEIERFC